MMRDAEYVDALLSRMVVACTKAYCVGSITVTVSAQDLQNLTAIAAQAESTEERVWQWPIVKDDQSS